MNVARKLLISVVLFCLSTLVYAPRSIETEMEMLVHIKIQMVVKNIKKYKAEQMKLFLQNIGHYESGNNPNAWNKYGYIGKYQFGTAARKSTGFQHIGYVKFKSNPSIWSEVDQDIAMAKLMMKNQVHLSSIIIQCNNGKMLHAYCN